ncbi:hypothetical protein BCR33DRAFT_718477 [Rhizoclosmatium globosum]|uniref:Uncharacterized protein n=1 Tax=Rhizoclosmatium globosum TaxID=329046 RepID=A0A1Y2C5L4_9FUNG|nr:hypothetical protein BCR33DRAFT_718477 [Rhizoclosmatium globosum]|eukprot:ORY42323.1 hypothetical protein BCR33DRAFT_718477 [Rhizoclosmatium globosum]
MFKKKAKTPDVKASGGKGNEGLPPLPTDPKTPEVITKDTMSGSVEPPPEIKSVGVSIQPPSVKPQQAELYQPHNSEESGEAHKLDGHGVLGNDDDLFGEFQTHESHPSNAEPASSPTQTRTRTKTNESLAKPKKSLNKQLSSIEEVASVNERTRPATALDTHANTKRHLNDEDDMPGDLASKSPTKQKSPPPIKKAATKTKENDSPTAARKNGETVTVKKSKLKPVEGTVSSPKPIPKSSVAAAKPPPKKPKPKVTISEEPEVEPFTSEETSTENVSLSFDSDPLPQEEFGDSSAEKLDDFKFVDDKEEEEEEVRSNHSLKSKPSVERGRTPSKRQADSAKLTKTAKAATPKATTPAPARRSSSKASRSEKFQRRLQMKLDTDGFSAMGLSPSDDFGNSQGGKSDGHKRVGNQPAPPPHYLAPTAAIPVTKKTYSPPGKPTLSRNPSSRRKTIKALAYGVMGGEDDNRNYPTRFGHYDHDDRRSKSMDPGEYRNTLSRQRRVSDYPGGYDPADDDDIQELDGGVEYNANGYGRERAGRRQSNDDEQNSNSSQEYRYSDRISGKYNNNGPGREPNSLQKYPERLMLTSSALQAAQNQGMVSPETVNYLKWYMVKAKPLEATPEGSLTDVRNQSSTVPSKQMASESKSKAKPKPYGVKGSIMDDDDDNGRPLFSNKSVAPTRGSIMDDSPSDSRSKLFSKKAIAPIRNSGSIMDDQPAETEPPKPRAIPKTRVTIVSKPKPTSKKAAANPGQAEAPGMQQNQQWGQPFPFMGGFSPFGAPFMQQGQSYGSPSGLSHPHQPGGSFPPHQFSQHMPSQLPTYKSSMNSQPPLPSLNALALTAPPYNPPPPTVHPGLMPARIKLTTVPVVTFKQSYVIEPTGHAPGTYIPPEEMGMDANGTMLTYISTAGMNGTGGGGSYSYDVNAAMGGMGSVGGMGPTYSYDIKESAVNPSRTPRSMSNKKPTSTVGSKSKVPSVKTQPERSGVRGMIQKGVIGRNGGAMTGTARPSVSYR